MTDQSVSLPEVKATVDQSSVARPQPATAPPNMEARVPSQQVESSADSPREAQSDTMKPALLKQLLEDINREYKQRNISLRFSIHEATNSLVVRVLDIDTEKVIRQLPPDEILVLRTRMQEMLGEIFDAQA